MNLNLTLVGQAIAFAFFVWFCMKFIWPPVMQALQERQKKIADGLDAASRAARDLEVAEKEADETKRQAKEEAAEIREQAQKQRAQTVEKATQEAQQEYDRIVAKAKSEIEQEVARAKEELRAQVSRLAVLGAERILESSIDEKQHAAIVDKLAKEL